MKRSALWWRDRITRKSAIHKQLIDQSLVAGIGNIIAIEMLHRSGILPQTHPQALSAKQWELLARQAHIVVNESHHQHTQVREKELEKGFLRGELKLVSEGHTKAKGFSIYGRENIRCPQCETGIIQKAKLANRPIYWCSTCQK